MSYRDDRESLRGRVESLETELTEAREKIARLQGEAPANAADPASRSYFAAPPPLELERELPGKLTDAGFEAIADILRDHYPMGHISQVGRTLSQPWNNYRFRVGCSSERGIRLRLSRSYSEWRVLAPVYALLFGGVPFLLALRAFGSRPVALLLVIPLIVLGTWAGVRALAARRAGRENKRLRGLFEAVSDIASEHAKCGRVRVSDVDTSEEARAGARAQSEAEALAEATEADAEAEADRAD